MKKNKHILRYLARSGFIRSVFLRVISIFLIVSVVISTVAFLSFSKEISKNVLADRKTQLSLVEKTITSRMEEVSSIAYNISIDPTFYIESIAQDNSSGYEMSKTLERYLVGNNFIEHLAYYRLSEPDKIYISTGERSLKKFFMSDFKTNEAGAEKIISSIRSTTKTTLVPVSSHWDKEENSQIMFFAYTYPLPQLSENPQAFIMALIPFKEIEPLLEPLLTDEGSEIGVFDSKGNQIYCSGKLNNDKSLTEYVKNGKEEQKYTSYNGTRYVLQKVVSEDNGWTYVAAIKKSSTMAGLTTKLLVFIVCLLLFMFICVIAMILSIISQYEPISNLAESFIDKSPKTNKDNYLIDERQILSDTLKNLSKDSAQKQKFEDAYHEAEAASKAKSAFLSNMSHDIRTPMNAVIGMTAIALNHIDDSEYVKDCLKKVQISSQYLLDIINNVLDMSRIESGRFSLTEEVINLQVLIDGLVSIIGSSAEAKCQNLEVNIEGLKNDVVIGDNIRLTQVFINILSNSVKFTPNGGTIKISVQQLKSNDKDKGTYVFKLSDTGVGMTPEFVEHVFDTFSRAEDSTIAKTEGTGLGMAIAKNLVKLMGGTIVCESKLGEGTTFTVTMHLKLATDTSTLGVANHYHNKMKLSDYNDSYEPINLEGKRILLVDDNTINREIAHKILTETKAEIIHASNGQEAVNAFCNNEASYFDIILMDIQMPIMNGYEATAIIRAYNRPDAKTIPIFAMTANAFDEDVRQVKDAGMDGHIAKPYTPIALYNILSIALNLE